ncbi:MAG: AMP-binding protein [Hyphomonadaceae bacterium]
MAGDASRNQTDLPPFLPLPFRLPDIEVRRGGGGAIYLSSRTAVPKPAQSIPHVLDTRAGEHPDRVWLRERSPGHGPWRQVTFGEAASTTRRLGQALLDRGLGPDAPLMILSGNSIEHALMSIAAQRIEAPATPVSMAYATLSSDFERLKYCFDAVRPKAIFVQTMEPFRRALAALPLDGVVVISADGADGSEALAMLAETRETSALDDRMARLSAQSVGKFLFTSGSTGMPKPAPQTQGAMTAQLAALRALQPDGAVDEDDQVSLDWMPWSHISGGNVNFNRSIEFGATFHIDDGRPAAGLFDATIDNLKDIRPQYFGSAPIAFGMLAEAMEKDPALRDAVFSRMQYFVYGGATLSEDLYARLQKLAIAARGLRVPLLTMYGATETQGVTMTHWPIERVGMVGLPIPGLTLKLAPVGDKLEVRVKGTTVMSGYHNLPEKNAEAFDDEGFYCLGDAARFEDPEHPEKGLVFDGRVTEDFKLDSGTWVSVGTLRPAVVAACAPLVQDAVICGQDKPYVGSLVWPSPGAWAAALANAAGDETSAVEALSEQVAARIEAFNAAQGGASRRIRRFRLLLKPPSLDEGEITDKGYINQRKVQDLRVEDVTALFD